MSQMSQSIKLFNSFKTSDLLRRWVLLKICSVDAFANNAYGVSNLRKFVIKYRAVTISQLKLDMADIVTGTSSSHSSTTNFLSSLAINSCEYDLLFPVCFRYKTHDVRLTCIFDKKFMT